MAAEMNDYPTLNCYLNTVDCFWAHQGDCCLENPAQLGPSILFGPSSSMQAFSLNPMQVYSEVNLILFRATEFNPSSLDLQEKKPCAMSHHQKNGWCCPVTVSLW